MIRRKTVLASFAIFVLFSTTAAVAAAVRPPAAEQKTVIEREKRLLQLVGDKLARSRKLAQEDITVLERVRDAVTPLEPSRCEEDLTDLLDWHYRYEEVLADEEKDIGDLMAALSSAGAGPERMDLFGAVAEKEHSLALEMADKVERYLSERKRLTRLLERRQLLQSLCIDLREKLARFATKEGEASRTDREEERSLKRQIKEAQTELQVLPVLDEAIIKHYTVLVEYGQWQREWLYLDEDVDDALRSVAVLVPSSDVRDVGSMIQAHQRLIRTFDNQILRLTRMADDIERKRSKVTPAGSYLEMERSRELVEFFDRLQQRLDSRTRELKIAIGGSEAEVAELRTLEP